jgi:hypothetical protein
MTFNGVIHLALGVIACELAEFRRRYAAGRIGLVQREFVRGSPSEYGQREQQKKPATRRPDSTFPFAGEGMPIVIR